MWQENFISRVSFLYVPYTVVSGMKKNAGNKVDCLNNYSKGTDCK